MKILYSVDATGGGILAYAIEQAKALEEAGAKVTLLHRKGLEIRGVRNAVALLPEKRTTGSSRFLRLSGYLKDARISMTRLQQMVNKGTYDLVLLDCFREYLSPFWVSPLRRLRRKGQRIGVINHDPVRDFAVGPKWWHDYSIRSAMSCFTDVFVHDDRRIDWGGGRQAHIRVHTLPHGPFRYPEGGKGRDGQRKAWKVEKDDFVFLSFGQVRDGKQLDLILQALAKLPDRVKLVIAGKGDSQSQKPVSWYQDLASELGVVDRCHWENRYIDDREVSDLFYGADAVLTTYSEKFVSASGVLSTAVAYERPVLASAGGGPMETALANYPIGEWVEPGDLDSVIDKMTSLMKGEKLYEFQNYNQNHSWEANARVVLEALHDGS